MTQDRYAEKAAEMRGWGPHPACICARCVEQVAEALREVAAEAWEEAAHWTDIHPRRWRADLTQDFKDKARQVREGR